MNTFQFLKTYLLLQKDIILNEVYEAGNAIISLSTDTSPFWNNALVNTVLTGSEINQINNELISHGRSPAYYYENRRDLEELTTSLVNEGFGKEAEDSFMFHPGDSIDTARFNCVKEVHSEEDLKVFLDTFNSCYRNDDPLNPYGELGEYLHAAKTAWLTHRGTGRLHYYITFKQEKPVAVSALTNFDGIGYISNVGSLPSVRGEGFGKVATLFTVQQSAESGNTQHCLATEENTNPNSFYKALGFTTKFKALLMVKK